MPPIAARITNQGHAVTRCWSLRFRFRLCTMAGIVCNATARCEACAHTPCSQATHGNSVLDAHGRLNVGKQGFNMYLVHTTPDRELDLVLGDRCATICDMFLSKGLQSPRYQSCNDEGSSTLTVAAKIMGTHWLALWHCMKSGSNPDFVVRICAQAAGTVSCTGALAILPGGGRTREFCVSVKRGQTLPLWVYASRDEVAEAEGEVWRVDSQSDVHVVCGSWAANEHGKDHTQHAWNAEMVQHIQVTLSQVGVHVIELHWAAAVARAVVRVNVRPEPGACSAANAGDEHALEVGSKPAEPL